MINRDVDCDDELIRQVTLPVGEVVEQLLFTAQTVVRTSSVTAEDRARIEDAIATLNATLNKKPDSDKPIDRSAYGQFDPSIAKLSVEEMRAFVDS